MQHPNAYTLSAHLLLCLQVLKKMKKAQSYYSQARTLAMSLYPVPVTEPFWVVRRYLCQIQSCRVWLALQCRTTACRVQLHAYSFGAMPGLQQSHTWPVAEHGHLAHASDRLGHDKLGQSHFAMLLLPHSHWPGEHVLPSPAATSGARLQPSLVAAGSSLQGLSATKLAAWYL